MGGRRRKLRKSHKNIRETEKKGRNTLKEIKEQGPVGDAHGHFPRGSEKNINPMY